MDKIKAALVLEIGKMNEQIMRRVITEAERKREICSPIGLARLFPGLKR